MNSLWFFKREKSTLYNEGVNFDKGGIMFEIIVGCVLLAYGIKILIKSISDNNDK